MSALNAALCRRGIILWLAAVLLLASRSTHSAPVYDQDTTQIAEYDAATVGCYFNFQRYQEGDRIMTSEPCLNCTCHNRMLMCYLKVCPFTKAIGQDCTVEKRPDQCCPVITCPEVPVQLLTSTTSAPAGSDSMEVGFHDNYGCHVDKRFYADGAMLPLDHHNPCELCYCIRNRTTCVMQECTLRVAGCKPIYQPGACCPIKYDCEYEEESSTTVGPTPGLIITTTLPPGVLPQCYYENKIYEDGDLINSSQPCQHCYCFRGEIACAVQNCGTPMQAHGKNCTALPPPEGECCPITYECEEDEQGVLPEEGKEQIPEQTPHEEQITTESPIIIDQEDQQVKDEHPQEETTPSSDNAIPFTTEGEEEKGVQGTIEHVTKEQIPATEKPEEQSVTPSTEENAVPETETTTVEKGSTLSPERDTEISPTAVTPEVISEVPSETEATKTEMPTSTYEQTEESLITEAPKLPEASSTLKGLQSEKEAITTEHISEEHISTTERIFEKEYNTPAATEKEQSTEPSIGKEIQTKATTEPEFSSHKEISEEMTTTEKIEISEKPETSTEIIEKATSPIAETEESGIVPESTTEQIKEDKNEVETTSGETLATETESSVEKETTTVGYEMSSTEQAETEVSHPTKITVTEESQLTTVSSPPEEQSVEKEQQPVTEKDEQEQRPEEPTSEHATIKEEPATVGAKKEDSGLTESPDISKGSVTEEEHVEEESTPEIPVQGPTGIPIPERSPEQKAEDENIYHVTDDYHDVTRPEVNPDNLVTESPQKTPTTYLPQEQEIPSEETQKPIEEEGTEIPKETVKPISEEVTIIPTQHKPEITEITTEETKAETIPAIIKTKASTETSVTTIASVEHEAEEKIPEEIEKPSVSEKSETEIPEEEVQFTEEIPTGEEMPTKGLDVSGESSSSEEVSGEQGEKKVQPKKEPSEEEAGTQFPTTELEVPVSIPEEERSTELPNLEEQPTEGEQVTTVIPSVEQSTQVPQIEEKIELATIEVEKPVTSEKPVEEHVTEQSTTSPSITSGEDEKELQTTESISIKEQTTEAEEKSTTQTADEEQKTEQPKQYSTEKAPEESTITESHMDTKAPKIEERPQEVEGIPTESAEQTETPIIRKEPSTETEVKPTEITEIIQTELPVIVEHPIKVDKAEKEGEGQISVITEIQTDVPAAETEFTEAPILEQQTEKAQTEPSVTGGMPSQPSIPLDRKEDQEFIEPILNKEDEGEEQEQITQKPSLEEKEVSEISKESQKPTVSSEVEVTHVPSEEIVTKSAPSEEKPTQVADTTESIDAAEATTQPPVEQHPEVASEQPAEAATKPLEQEEQTQGPVIKEPEGILTIEITSVTPTSEISIESVTGEDVDIKSTQATASEGTTISELISEMSTESPEPVGEKIAEPEIPVERQPETHEEVTQSSTTEEKPSEEGETERVSPEISTEKAAIPETPKVSISKEKPQEQKEVAEESTETPEREVQSTLAPEDTPQVKVTTEISQYSTELSTSIPEKESPTEEESILEITPRPSGIPGEGNCLVEGQSYNNNSAVPPANLCQTSCRCVSSIVQCELVQCPAPPAHLSNCMPIHRAEECCPMYTCDETSTIELKSDSHKVESPETVGEEQITPTTELLTEAPFTEITVTSKESSTAISELSTSELQPAEVTIPSVLPPEGEIKSTATEKQLTTPESTEQPTTIGQPVEQYPEEHIIGPVSETSEESATQVPVEKEHTTPEEITEKEEEVVTKSAVSTKQPIEEQTTASGEEQPVITSTNIPLEQEPGVGEEGSTDLHKEEVTIPTASEEQETSTSVEIEASTSAESIPTIAPNKEEESTTPSEEQEKPTGEKDVKEQSTFKPIEEGEIEQPEEEKIQPIPTSEESITEEQEISIKPEEQTVTDKLPVKPEVSEEQATIEPSEYESTSVFDILSTTEQKHEETEHEEEKEQETITSTEGERVIETEKPESQTKLPTTIASDKVEEPVESTTLMHDYAITKEAPLEDHTIAKSEEVSTEENKDETKPAVSTEVSEIEAERATTPSLFSEVETPGEESAKATEEPVSEISHEETSAETVEPTKGAAEIETTEHAEHSEPSITEGEPSVTKLPEKSIEVESPVTTEQTTIKISEAEYEKSTESSIVHEPEGTQVPIEVHPELTSEMESHTSKLPEEHTIPEKILTTSLPISEQPSTETVPSLGKEQTEQFIVAEVESETPVIKEEHVTTPTEEQTPESVEVPVEVEKQTIATSISSEDEATEQITPESVTIQEEQKTTDGAKPETELPDLTEEQTTSPHKEEEKEQKPETGIKEEPVTIPEVSTEETTEGAVTSVGITEGHLSAEEYIPQEVTPSKVETDVISQQPIETTTAQEEQGLEKEIQVTSEISLPQHPLSEGTTTMASQIFEEHLAVSTETAETEEPHEYETASIAEEEISKPVTEISELEKLSPEKESTTEGLEPEEIATRIPEISPTEKSAETLPETETPVQQEQKTELPEQDKTTIKSIEGIVPKEKLPEEVEVEVKSTKATPIGEEEEGHSTTPTAIETTSVQAEEQPSIKLQPTEEYFPSLSPQEIQPTQPEESEDHTSVTKKEHPSLSEESQSTTEYAPEIPVTIKTIERLPETEQTELPSETTAFTEGPSKVFGMPTELPEEKTTIRPLPEDSETQASLRPEEGPQTTETSEELLKKTQSTELPSAEITEIPEEVSSQESEEVGQPHVEKGTVKPETLGSDEEHLRPVNHTAETTESYQPSFHEQRPTSTSTSHIPEYPDQTIPSDNPHFPEDGGSYLHPDEDYDEDDQIYGPGTCRYGGKVYVSAQQIPRDDPCDFCFCFRSDIICLQQSCPPPIPGCHEEPISGFCCPRYECPVSMATALNLTTTTTTTTTTLPPHFHAHAYKGAAKRSGCQIDGHAYRVGEVIISQSGPCTHCICGGDGKMKCEPLVCSPEPMLRQMIAAATAKRRR